MKKALATVLVAGAAALLGAWLGSELADRQGRSVPGTDTTSGVTHGGDALAARLETFAVQLEQIQADVRMATALQEDGPKRESLPDSVGSNERDVDSALAGLERSIERLERLAEALERTGHLESSPVDGLPKNDGALARIAPSRGSDVRENARSAHFGWSQRRVYATFGVPDRTYHQTPAATTSWTYKVPENGVTVEFTFADGMVIDVNIL